VVKFVEFVEFLFDLNRSVFLFKVAFYKYELGFDMVSIQSYARRHGGMYRKRQESRNIRAELRKGIVVENETNLKKKWIDGVK